MLDTRITYGTPFVGTLAMPYLDYHNFSSNYAYDPSRQRTPLATTVVEAISAAVCSVMVTGTIDRSELFERYDRKLWSYQDHVARFALATLPSVVALAAIYIGFRGLKGLRGALSL